jgi:hypothetical protein
MVYLYALELQCKGRIFTFVCCLTAPDTLEILLQLSTSCSVANLLADLLRQLPPGALKCHKNRLMYSLKVHGLF